MACCADRAERPTPHAAGHALPTRGNKGSAAGPCRPLTDPGNVRHFIADSGRQENSPSGEGPSRGEADNESGFDTQNLTTDQFDAVAGDLIPSLGQEVSWRHPVPGQESLHVC